MEREIMVTNFEDFVCQLYKEIEKAAERGDGLQLELSPLDCLKWSTEHIDNIECS